MSQIDKTVFISYRRTNQFTALAIFKDLTARGYDVFFDYNSINSGDFEQIILREIEARGHFIIILTPSALERCNDPNDWVRREIEHALLHKRNIIPLMSEGFKFEDADKYLTGNLVLLKKYNGLSVPIEYFDAAMDRLDSKYLSIEIDAILHPTPPANEKEVAQAIQNAKAQENPTRNEMTAEEYFESAYKRDDRDLDGKIQDYSEAIRLNPRYAEAYNNRGRAFHHKGKYDQAISDYDRAINLKSSLVEAYINRGVVYGEKRMYEESMSDYAIAIKLKPDLAEVYVNRGNNHIDNEIYDEAITDYTYAISLQPTLAEAYLNRGVAYRLIDEYESAMRDYNEAIKLNLHYTDAYINRGWLYYLKGEYDSAIKDFNKSCNLDPQNGSAFNNRGFVYYRKGNYDNAIADFNNASHLFSNKEAYYYLNHGIMCQKSGELEQANLNYQKYVNLHGLDADEVLLWIEENNRRME